MWSLFSLAVVALTGSVFSEELPVTQKCCFPEQFTSLIAVKSGFPADDIPGMQRTENTLQFDYTNRRWGYRVRLIFSSGDWRDVFWIEDFKAGTLTFIRETCKKYTTLKFEGDMALPCVPEHAKFAGKHKLSTLDYESWEWDGFADTRNYGRIPAHFALNFLTDCTPMTTMLFSEISNGTFMWVPYYEYMEVELGLPAPENDMFADAERYIKYNGCVTVNEEESNRYRLGDVAEGFDALLKGVAYSNTLFEQS